jgi:hypothetical protein
MTQTRRQFLQWSAAGKETMKPIKNTLLCTGLALAFGVPALAAGDRPPATAGRTTREPRSAVRRRRRATPDEKDYKELSGQVVYQVTARRSGAAARQSNEFASQAYADLAVRTRDPAVIERAIEVAGYARRSTGPRPRTPVVQVEPDSKRAQQVLVGVMIMTNQFDGLAPQLISMLEADQERCRATSWRSTGCLPAARIVRRSCS